MRIVIFGAGGVGGYFGGRLAQSGADVTFIARGAHLNAIRESGLRVESIDGDFSVHPAKASASPTSIGAADLILLAVKAWQLDDSITQLKPLVGGSSMLLPLMNGMEHMDKLFEAFGTEHVLGGLCRISAILAGAGYIRHVGIQPYIAYGEWDKSKSARVEAVHEMFAALPGITAEQPADIQAAMWEKFIFIAATSGVGAYTRQSTGEYRANPESRGLLASALNETTAIARARGISIANDFVDATLQRIDKLPANMTASMQKDMIAGKPSELNEQTGAVVRMGKAVGVPTPTHEKLLTALLPLEQKARAHL